MPKRTDLKSILNKNQSSNAEFDAKITTTEDVITYGALGVVGIIGIVVIYKGCVYLADNV